jgi:hypothetical protein
VRRRWLRKTPGWSRRRSRAGRTRLSGEGAVRGR